MNSFLKNEYEEPSDFLEDEIKKCLYEIFTLNEFKQSLLDSDQKFYESQVRTLNDFTEKINTKITVLYCLSLNRDMFKGIEFYI